MPNVPLSPEVGLGAFVTLGAGDGLHGGSLLAVGTSRAGQAGVRARQWAEGARLAGQLAVGPCGAVETGGASVSMGSIRG